MSSLSAASVVDALANIKAPDGAVLVGGAATQAWYPEPTDRSISDIDTVLPSEGVVGPVINDLVTSGWRIIYRSEEHSRSPKLFVRATLRCNLADLDIYVDSQVEHLNTPCIKHSPVQYNSWVASSCDYAMRFILQRALIGSLIDTVNMKFATDIEKYCAAHETLIGGPE